ncbi:hypothetical protein JM18_009589, partial [Phytophthora kernoviae]
QVYALEIHVLDRQGAKPGIYLTLFQYWWYITVDVSNLSCKYSVDHRTQLEESIHQEDKKLKYVEVKELFQLSSKGDDVTLASRHNFDSKLNKGEVLTVKKLQQYPQTLEQSVKPKKSKKIQALWG